LVLVVIGFTQVFLFERDFVTHDIANSGEVAVCFVGSFGIDEALTEVKFVERKRILLVYRVFVV